MSENLHDLPGNGGARHVKTFVYDPGEVMNHFENGHETPEAEEREVIVEMDPVKKHPVEPRKPFTAVQNGKRISAMTVVTGINFSAMYKVVPLGKYEYLADMPLVGVLFQNPAFDEVTISASISMVLAIGVTTICHMFWEYFTKHDLTVNVEWVLSIPKEKMRFYVLCTLYILSIGAEIVALSARLQQNDIAITSVLMKDPGMGFFATAALSLLLVAGNAGVGYLNAQNFKD
jgi:hypothetical protein